MLESTALYKEVFRILESIFMHYHMEAFHNDSCNCAEFRILMHKNQLVLDDDTLLLHKLSGEKYDVWIDVNLVTRKYCLFGIRTVGTGQDDILVFEPVVPRGFDDLFKRIYTLFADIELSRVVPSFSEKTNSSTFQSFFMNYSKWFECLVTPKQYALAYTKYGHPKPELFSLTSAERYGYEKRLYSYSSNDIRQGEKMIASSFFELPIAGSQKMERVCKELALKYKTSIFPCGDLGYGFRISLPTKVRRSFCNTDAQEEFEATIIISKKIPFFTIMLQWSLYIEKEETQYFAIVDRVLDTGCVSDIIDVLSKIYRYLPFGDSLLFVPSGQMVVNEYFSNSIAPSFCCISVSNLKDQFDLGFRTEEDKLSIRSNPWHI